MPYRFRLEAVRQVRQTQRDELRGRLAEAFAAADKLAGERRGVEGEIADADRGLLAATRAAAPDVERIMRLQRWRMQLHAQLADIRCKAERVEQEVQRRRAAVLAAEQQVRSLDLLDDRHRADAERAAHREQTREADEAAGVAWRRGRVASRGGVDPAQE